MCCDRDIQRVLFEKRDVLIAACHEHSEESSWRSWSPNVILKEIDMWRQVKRVFLTYGNVNKYKETYNSTIYNQATVNKPLLLICEAHWGRGRKLRLELLHMPCPVFILYATCLQTFFDYISILVKFFWTVTSTISTCIYTIYTRCYLSVYSVQFSSVAQSCPTLCDPMNRSTPGLPVHHQLLEFTQTHVHRVSDAI